VVVVHGPAVKAFADIGVVDKVRSSAKAHQADGVAFDVLVMRSNLTFDLEGRALPERGGKPVSYPRGRSA
jgi:hypothetical protein